MQDLLATHELVEGFHRMAFHEQRRQQFLSEPYYKLAATDCTDGIRNIEGIILEAILKNDKDYVQDRSGFQALLRLELLFLHYTAGEPIEPLRHELEHVVAAYERYAEKLRQYEENPNAVPLLFGEPGHYLMLLQLLGMCFLLHRRDLLPRVAALEDGVDGANGGTDALFEEFLIHGMGAEARYQSDYLHHIQPYEHLFYALTEDDKAAAFVELNTYLKVWYKKLKGLPQHDTHKPDENGNQGGYYGYWSFEAGAAVILLGIEDDSSLHQYLYYPKDLVAWSRSFRPDDLSVVNPAMSRVEAGKACPRSGWWTTPAKAGIRRYFEQGTVMPSLGSDYGLTIWQWDSDQSTPHL